VAADWLAGGAGASPGRWPSPELARRVGWVPQQAELAVVSRTVREDVLSTSRLLGLDLDAAGRRADALLEALGLAHLAGTDPHRLSGGEMRRLALAGAVAHGPAVLVLDEPTVGQDRLTWAAVAGVVAAARSAGVAVVLATHDPLLARLADRTVRLEGGRVVSAATTPAAAPPAAPSAVSAPPAAPTPAVPAPRVSARTRGLAGACGPLSLLAVSALLLAGSLFVRDLRTALLALGVELLLAPAVLGLRRPSSGRGRPAVGPTARATARRLAPGVLGVLSVAFSNWLLSPGHDVAAGATAGLRVAFFVVPGVLLAARVDPFVLGDHLGQRLRLPARPVVAAVAALQRFESLDQQWHQLRRTRRVRGLDVGRSPLARARQVGALTAGVLVQSLRQAGRMAVAMEARGFSTPRAQGRRRTWAEPAPWRSTDSLMVALGLAVAAVPALLWLAR
jgi:energy-coupling factor transport system ATP-binding protein